MQNVNRQLNWDVLRFGAGFLAICLTLALVVNFFATGAGKSESNVQSIIWCDNAFAYVASPLNESEPSKIVGVPPNGSWASVLDDTHRVLGNLMCKDNQVIFRAEVAENQSEIYVTSSQFRSQKVGAAPNYAWGLTIMPDENIGVLAQVASGDTPFAVFEMLGNDPVSIVLNELFFDSFDYAPSGTNYAATEYMDFTGEVVQGQQGRVFGQYQGEKFQLDWGTDSPAWSPDGKFITLKFNNQIWVYDFSDHLMAAITDLGKFTNFSAPSWSPNAKWISFSADQYALSETGEGGPQRSVFVYDTATQEISTIGIGGNFAAPVWSDSSQYLAFVNHGQINIADLKKLGLASG